MELTPGDHEHNANTLLERSRISVDGVPLPLVKMSGGESHEGGALFSHDSDEYKQFALWIERGLDQVNGTSTCPETAGTPTLWARLVLLDEPSTIRRAYRHIAGTKMLDELLIARTNGVRTTPDILYDMLDEDGAGEWIKMIHNDELHTDKYRHNGVDVLSNDNYPDKNFWDNKPYSDAQKSFWKSCAHEAVGREPLNTAWEIIRRDLPYTELVQTSVAVNPCSAQVYGIDLANFSDPTDPDEFIFMNPLTQPEGGGVFASDMTNIRWQSTDTNRNRARARYHLDFTLGIDIMTRGNRPVDPGAVASFNPTMQIKECTKCHTDLDPIAGLFQNRENSGRYRVSDDFWYADMFAPGIDDTYVLPFEEKHRALAWFGDTVHNTPDLLDKFRKKAIVRFFEAVTGQTVHPRPTDVDDPLFDAKTRGVKEQDLYLAYLLTLLKEKDDNMKHVIVALLMSPYFRATHVEGELTEEEAAELATLGNRCAHRPQQLVRVIESLGFFWNDNNGIPLLTDPGAYLFFAGGADSDNVLDPLCEANGFSALVWDRMAREISCKTVATDFARPQDERIWFPLVEYGDIPSYQGEAVPGLMKKIVDNIGYMHTKIFGTEMTSTERDEYATLATATHDACATEVSEGTWSIDLPQPCKGYGTHVDEETGDTIEFSIQKDEHCSNATWQALLEFMLTDPRVTHAIALYAL